MTDSHPSFGVGGTSSKLFWALLGLFVPLMGVPGEAEGQAASVGSGCDVPHFEKFTNVALSNGSRITYFSYPIIVCSGGTRISADSAVVYEATNYTQLFRNVVFEDADSRLTASEAHYFDQERRLRAWGNVVMNDQTEGSIIRGDTMILLRTGPGRPEDQITVLGRRPQATFYPTRQPIPVDTLDVAQPDSLSPPLPDSAGVADPEETPPPRVERALPPSSPAERVPWEIEAKKIFLEGSRYFRATGLVTIHRDSVDAAADSVEYDGDAGALFLARDSRLTTSNFDLSAEFIRLDIPQDEIREVLARQNSVLKGEDLQLLAPTLFLFLTEGRLERLVARRDSLLDALPEEALLARPPHPAAQALGFERFPIRPHAYAQDYLLWADSIEVLAPGEELEELRAMGQARGESLAGDSLNTEFTPELARRDWLEGDTVIAIFVPNTPDPELGEGEDPVAEIAPPPSAGSVSGREAQPDSSGFRLERLIARVGAKSLYRMAASDSTVAEEEERQAIHYVVGDEITILMSEGEVDHMEVMGATRGIHLEPVGPPRRGGNAGSDMAPPDIQPDTATVPRRTGGGGR